MHAIRRTGPFPLTPLLLMVGVTGCALVEPRDPEPPNAAGSRFEAPTSPTTVLRNLESSIASANALDYRRSFADSSRGLPRFTFIPSAEGLAAAPEAFVSWGIESEENWARNAFALLSPREVPSLVLTPSEVTAVPIGDSILYNGHYQLRIPHTKDGVEREAEGDLQLTLRRSTQNEWYIARWRDAQVAGKTSWSLVKGRFIDR